MGFQIPLHELSYYRKLTTSGSVQLPVVNNAAISNRTNRTIGGGAPSHYVAVVEGKPRIPSERLYEYLKAHLVAPRLSAADDFEKFFLGQRKTLRQVAEGECCSAPGRSRKERRGPCTVRGTGERRIADEPEGAK